MNGIGDKNNSGDSTSISFISFCALINKTNIPKPKNVIAPAIAKRNLTQPCSGASSDGFNILVVDSMILRSPLGMTTRHLLSMRY